MSRKSAWKDATGPLVYAHRGVSSEFPENTIEAFGAARFRGAHGVELDARRLLDADLAVHHDARLADGRALVELRVDELPPLVPTLEAALDACSGLVVNVELKNLPGEPDFDPESHLADLVVAELGRLGVGETILISSFNLGSIERVHELDPTLATGWLLADLEDLESLLDRAVESGVWAVHPPVTRTSAAFIAAAHDRGLRVNTWTVDDPIRIEQLLRDGVDGIITNDPAMARARVDAHLAG